MNQVSFDVESHKEHTMLPPEAQKATDQHLHVNAREGAVKRLLFDELKAINKIEKPIQSIMYRFKKPDSTTLDGTFCATPQGWTVIWDDSKDNKTQYRFEAKSNTVFCTNPNDKSVQSKLKHIVSEIAAGRTRMIVV